MGLRSTLYLPKEHGSWGMFFIPLLLGLIVGGEWHGGCVLFIGAATAAFLAREPFMAAWRGWRRKTDSGRATRTVAAYGTAAIALGAPLLADNPWLAALGAAGAALYVWHAEAAMRGEGRSAGVELLVIATSMLTAPAAYYVGTGRLDGLALTLWLATFGYFASTVFYVKMRLTAARARSEAVKAKARRECVAAHAALALGIAALPVIVALGYVPAIIRAGWYAARPTAEANLKQIGWTEVVLSLVFFVAAAVGLRP
jgi:uncharacterized membrane protein